MAEAKAPSLSITRAQLLTVLHDQEVHAREVDPVYVEGCKNRSAISVAESRTKNMWKALNEAVKGKQE